MSTVEITPAGTEISGILGGLELPVFDFNEFVGMTANKLKDWFINFLPNTGATICWGNVLNNVLDGFGKILDTEFVDETVLYANREVESTVAGIRDFNAYLKQQQSAIKAEQSRIQSTIQSLIYYEDCDDTLSLEDLTAKRAVLTEQRDALKAMLVSIKHQSDVQAELDKVNLICTAETEDADETFKRYETELSNLKVQLSDLEAVQRSLSEKRAVINAAIADKRKVIAGAGQCPYTCSQCETISKLIEIFKSDIENLTKEFHDAASKIEANYVSADSVKQEIQTVQSKKSEIYNAYQRKYLLLKQLSPELSDMSAAFVSEQISGIESEITVNHDLIIKIMANRRYNELTDKLTSDKFKAEQNVEILKVWIKLTDVNGLQSELMNKPFLDLEEIMSEYLRKFYLDNTIMAKFRLSGAANSFCFGMERNSGDFLSFDLLSGGEKCLFIFALLLSIVKMSKTQLPYISIDDTLGQLDSDNFGNLFNVLSTVDDVQILIAGVHECSHARSEEFIIKVGN